MGGGIAQLACMAGYETRLYDLDRKALERAIEVMRNGLRRGVERERWSEDEATAALSRLKADQTIELMKGCDLVIEAAPEDIELKRDLFHRLAGVCADRTVLATNTSSLSVTAIAAGIPHEERVVGMHFFNPPPLMKLVEIVAGDESGEGALGIATEVAERMGRRPIRARDGIGFVANRCVRPFNLEALRMLGEGVGTHEEIDRVYRLAGGFRMGPFELMDLIGIDVNFAVARSFHEQSFGEPRWRPHPIQARMVAAGRLGRKTKRGFYSYADGPHRDRDPEADPDKEPERPILDADEAERIAGPLAPAIMDRLGATAVNEAAFALADEVATAEDIDTAMMLGFNWPIGPISWGERLGHTRVVGILDELRELHGEAYRAAPSLRG
jgi:3-hydroxybutyryl-CoA dehydrogenase